jgi:ribokinase
MVSLPFATPRIVVVGSCNVDLIAEVDVAPADGETVMGKALAVQPGGKGLNQAVAAAGLGAEVDLVSRVGDDEHRGAIFAALDKHGVGRRYVSIDPEQGTGLAMIVVDATGENRIVVNPRANAALGGADIASAADAICAADGMLLSLEVPLPALVAAAKLAGPHTEVCLNAAPAQAIPAELAAGVSVLIVNEGEAASLVGFSADDVASAQRAAASLRTLVRRAAVVTLGELGAVFASEGASGHVPAFATEVRDTTGAGDSFCAALTFALASGMAVRDAVVMGNAAGSLAARTLGATSSQVNAAGVAELTGW